MKVLIVHASKLGGTAEIAEAIGSKLTELGIESVVAPASDRPHPAKFDAVIVGGALYANRWPKSARKYIKAYAPELHTMPVWLFSSGPLDDTFLDNLPPTEQVAEFMETVAARDHITFGGRLEKDARGFLASSMAKNMAGDWRDDDQITAWAESIAIELQRSNV